MSLYDRHRFNPDRDFDKFRVAQWNDSSGRGWCVVDRTTDEVLARFPTGNGEKGAYPDAKADAARRNLQAYLEHRETTDA